MSAQSARDWLRLSAARGLGAKSIATLIAHFGSPGKALSASPASQRAAGLRDAQIDALERIDTQKVDAALAWLEHPDHHLITLLDASYPAQLKDIPDPPAMLFVDGDPDLLQMASLAIVGSRNPTSGGRDNALQFSRFLASRGLVIVSGLASGIDTSAHGGALRADGATIAVLGTGIDQYYPKENQSLQRRIATEGVVISEYPPDRGAAAGQFPARNRLISGLSLGTLVVEATNRSGSLITARMAGEQGRSVFAIPGSIHNPLARGCHQLIRQGALLVETADDIFSELAPSLGSLRQPTTPTEPPTTPVHKSSEQPDQDYQRVLDALGWDTVGMDTLVERTGLTAAELSSMLLIMELDGQVRSAPGGGFTRCSQSKA
ncbi:MAG: DNA-processing protein DprA [Pseudomonadota bacterium]